MLNNVSHLFAIVSTEAIWSTLTTDTLVAIDPCIVPPSLSVLIAMSIVHTMDELKLTGNCLLGSRPLLSFDPVS